jgi:hypothetical protein
VATEYHKINSLQKRHTEGPLKGRFTGEWCNPVHEYLQHNAWYCREKVDGRNIRIDLRKNYTVVADDLGYPTYADPNNSAERFIGGRTDNAQIPAPLYAVLEELFPLDKLVDHFGNESIGTGITLYGEGFGAGIQKGGAYGPVDFILFDIKIGDFWLSEGAITGIAESLGLRRVPYQTMTLSSAISIVSSHELGSSIKEGEAEGLVCVPVVPLFDKWGQRVIVKVKGVDFQ